MSETEVKTHGRSCKTPYSIRRDRLLRRHHRKPTMDIRNASRLLRTLQEPSDPRNRRIRNRRRIHHTNLRRNLRKPNKIAARTRLPPLPHPSYSAFFELSKYVSSHHEHSSRQAIHTQNYPTLLIAQAPKVTETLPAVL